MTTIEKNPTERTMTPSYQQTTETSGSSSIGSGAEPCPRSPIGTTEETTEEEGPVTSRLRLPSMMLPTLVRRRRIRSHGGGGGSAARGGGHGAAAWFVWHTLLVRRESPCRSELGDRVVDRTRSCAATGGRRVVVSVTHTKHIPWSLRIVLTARGASPLLLIQIVFGALQIVFYALRWWPCPMSSSAIVSPMVGSGTYSMRTMSTPWPIPFRVDLRVKTCTKRECTILRTMTKKKASRCIRNGLCVYIESCILMEDRTSDSMERHWSMFVFQNSSRTIHFI